MSPLLLSVLVLASIPLAPQDSTPQPAPEASIPVRVTPEQAPEEAARRLASLYEGTLSGVQDGQDFAETPDYRRLIEIVSRYGEHELRDKTPRDFDRAAALANPAAWRGELVHVRGLLAGLKAERLAYPIGESTDVFRAIVTDPNDGIVIDFLHQPPELELERAVVETEAVFVRMVGYENKKGERQQAPYLIARDIRVLDTTKLERRTAFDVFALILIGAALAYLVIRIVMSMHSGKGRASADPERAARLIRERARAAIHSSRAANKP